VKIFVLAPKENWICDRIAEEWISNNEDLNTPNPDEADILWLLAGWCWNHIPIELLSSKKVVVTVHHIVPEKFNEQKLREFKIRDQFVDAYHVPNKKTSSLIKQITDRPIYVTSYWYDKEVWFREDKDAARKELGIPPDKFVIGSFQRDTEGNSGLPKLEKGPDLFCDFLEIMTGHVKNLHVLLGGWRRGYVIDRLKKVKISYTFHEKAPIDKLRKMYSACDLYIVSSRHEGGPQAILEAAAMKVPILSRDVGIASSVLTPYCIVDLPEQIHIPKIDWTEDNFKNVQTYEIKTHKENYIEMFRRVLS